MALCSRTPELVLTCMTSKTSFLASSKISYSVTSVPRILFLQSSEMFTWRGVQRRRVNSSQMITSCSSSKKAPGSHRRCGRIRRKHWATNGCPRMLQGVPQERSLLTWSGAPSRMYVWMMRMVIAWTGKHTRHAKKCGRYENM